MCRTSRRFRRRACAHANSSPAITARVISKAAKSRNYLTGFAPGVPHLANWPLAFLHLVGAGAVAQSVENRGTTPS
jgi:hypothetical protein